MVSTESKPGSYEMLRALLVRSSFPPGVIDRIESLNGGTGGELHLSRSSDRKRACGQCGGGVEHRRSSADGGRARVGVAAGGADLLGDGSETIENNGTFVGATGSTYGQLYTGLVFNNNAGGSFTEQNGGYTVMGVPFNNKAGVPGTIDLAQGLRTFNVFKGTSGSVDLLVSAAVTHGGLLKDGTGTMVLSSPDNNFAGGLVVQGGTLQITSPAPIAGGILVRQNGPFFGTLSVD